MDHYMLAWPFLHSCATGTHTHTHKGSMYLPSFPLSLPLWRYTRSLANGLHLPVPYSRRVDVSPDGEFILVSWMEPPYSYIVPCGRFPQRVQLWKRDGTVVSQSFA